MGVKNYLVEGVSCSGKTSVATELQRQGYHVIHGDRELAYKGDPKTGLPLEGRQGGAWATDVAFAHRHHLWCVERVKDLAADQSHAATFFCGGARNISAFIGLFDAVFILKLDRATLEKRLSARPEDEFGGKAEERRSSWRSTRVGMTFRRKASRSIPPSPSKRLLRSCYPTPTRSNSGISDRAARPPTVFRRSQCSAQ